jgi:uncharacterized protein (DUF1697 family)
MLPMKELVRMLEDAGCDDVRTYIQSGNAVYCATQARAARIPGALSRAIAARLGLEIPVVTRTAAELAAVARKNPFLKAGKDLERLHVMFLADRPSPSQVGKLDPQRSPGDSFLVQGREIYLHLANGAGRTKLTNQYFDSQLGTTSTMRNWKTVLALLAMMER